MERLGAELARLNDALAARLGALLDGAAAGASGPLRVAEELPEALGLAQLAERAGAQLRGSAGEDGPLDTRFAQVGDFALPGPFAPGLDPGALLADKAVAGPLLFAGLQRHEAPLFGVDAAGLAPAFHENVRLDGAPAGLAGAGVRARLFACGHLNGPGAAACVLCRAAGHRELLLVR